jgi:hypothetical protein
MAINVSDQFKVNVSLPVDSRIVAANSTARTNIQFKYDGLQVFDLSDRKTYVWNSSTTTWSPADVSGTGDVNRIPRWSSSAGLTSSCIYFTAVYGNSQGKVGVNTTSTIQGTFQINSPGAGSQPILISNYNTSNFIASNYYYSGTDQFFTPLVGSGAIKFRANGEIFFYSRSYNQGVFTPPALGITNDTESASGLVLRIVPDGPGFNGWVDFRRSLYLGGGSGGGALIRTNTVLSTVSTPDYSFLADNQTGIYRPASGTIGFSIAGAQKMILNSNGLLISSFDNVTSPASRLHIDGGNGVNTYIQITQGTTTGTTAFKGLLVGLSGAGYPYVQTRQTTTEFPLGNPILFAFSNGNIRYRFSSNQLSIYSNTNGENFATANGSANITGGAGSKVVIGSNSSSAVSGTFTVGTLLVPSNSIVAIEATFVTRVGGNFLSRKIFSQYSVGSGGTITTQNTGLATISGYTQGVLAQASSPSITGISNGGTFDISTTNQIKMNVSVTGSGNSVVSYTATIYDFA